MLHKYDDLEGMSLHATDGKVGVVKDVYFDDRDWRVRYLIADTGGWFSGHKVLLSPVSVDHLDPDDGVIYMDLTKKQIESSPPLAADEPVSRKMEARVVGHYGWPVYWAAPYPALDAPGLTPLDPLGQMRTPDAAAPHRGLGEVQTDVQTDTIEDRGLRSAKEVKGYGIRTQDGSIGHVDGFICDPDTWSIRYLVLDTRKFLPGKKVLIPPSLIRNVSWETGEVTVMTTESQIQDAPEYDDSRAIEPAEEAKLLAHFGHGSSRPNPAGPGTAPNVW